MFLFHHIYSKQNSYNRTNLFEGLDDQAVADAAAEVASSTSATPLLGHTVLNGVTLLKLEQK